MHQILTKEMDIKTLKQFYALMEDTRTVRLEIVKKKFANKHHTENELSALKNAQNSLKSISKTTSGTSKLLIDNEKTIDFDLTYELSECEKDIIYLEKGEEQFLKHLSLIHKDFSKFVSTGTAQLKDKQFNCFITDRDGTTNNYCGRYRSSIQSIYNAVFLTHFAKNKTNNSIFITSAPLQNPGIYDVSVNPPKSFIYAASKGREFIDLSDKRLTYPINDEKKKLIENFNKKIIQLIKTPEYEKFSLIGSGLQLKFGQTTIARQDITKTIEKNESLNFLNIIKKIVADIDPKHENFRIEDTGLDIEVILTVKSDTEGLKDFDKAEGVRYLNKVLDLNIYQGPHLVCGDTSSDIPMITAALEYTKDVYSIFVTKKEDLANKVKNICPNTIIVPEPDMLVTILYNISK